MTLMRFIQYIIIGFISLFTIKEFTIKEFIREKPI
jgi:hypothetical protein